MRRRWLGLSAVGLLGTAAVAAALFFVVPRYGENSERGIAQQSLDVTLPTPTDPLPDIEVPASDPLDPYLPLAHHIDPPDKSHDNPRMDGVLNGILYEYETAGLDAAMAIAPLALPAQSAVAITLYTAEGYGSAELALSLRAMGIEPRLSGENYIEAYVPLPQLAAISNLDEVALMEAVIPALPLQSGPGAFLNSATSYHNAFNWHQAGYKGQDVKVGIIDGGFSGYTMAKLPEPAGVLCYDQNPGFSDDLSSSACGGSGHFCDPDKSGAGACHGTAVTEAILAIAPEATLFLAAVGSKGELSAAVHWMVGKQVDIVNLSMSFSWDSAGDGTYLELDINPKSRFPFPQTKIKVQQTVDYAIQEGNITWVNAAGNSNKHTWYGRFQPHRLVGPTANDHSFKVPTSIQSGIRCNGMYVTHKEDLYVQLRWDDSWGGATQDLDLYIYALDGTKKSGRQGQTRQAGNVVDVPFEYVKLADPIPGKYCLVVHHYSGIRGQSGSAIPDWIQLQVFKGPELQYFSDSGSIENPAESPNPGLLAVGASAHNVSTIEDFSSRGPTPDGRVKPDIVGVDRVKSIAYSNKSFPGTSQAAPHVAGLAALVKQAYPKLSPAQIAAYLKSSADPRVPVPASASSTGIPNNTWGNGLAMLPLLPGFLYPCSFTDKSLGLLCDKELLLFFKQALIGTNSSALSTWQRSANVADFEGISVGSFDGTPPRVIGINLLGLSLSGTIPPELVLLPMLEGLNLASNQLTGTIPPVLGAPGYLTRLKRLTLDSNQLTGNIPPQLRRLSSLTVLNLTDNQLTGAIPPELGELRQLTTLYLSDNKLTGTIPPELGQLQDLKELHINNGKLLEGLDKSPLTSVMYGFQVQLSKQQLRQLQALSPGNKLTGPIPSELGNLRNLESLYLNANELTGPIPPELAQLHKLQKLSLWGNKLTGPIPPQLGQLSFLQGLGLDMNELTGAIPPELGNLAKLEELYLYENQLTGCIPRALDGICECDQLPVCQ